MLIKGTEVLVENDIGSTLMGTKESDLWIFAIVDQIETNKNLVVSG